MFLGGGGTSRNIFKSKLILFESYYSSHTGENHQLGGSVDGVVNLSIGCRLSVAGPGGGGPGGPDPPLLGHDVGFLTLGPKLDPPFFACRPKMQWRILWMTSHGQCPRGGACEKSCIRAWTPPPFKNPGSAPGYP